MKKFQSLGIRSLGSRGFSHIVAPVVAVMAVGVIGTFLVVSSHANSVSAATKAKTHEATNSTRPQKSFLVVYSSSFTYDSFKVQLKNGDTATHSCGGKFDATGNLARPLRFRVAMPSGLVYPPTTIACSPISGEGSYLVSFGNGNKFTADHTVSLDVDAGYCTYVHADATKISKAPVTANGKCGPSGSDTAVKKPAVVKIAPALSPDKKFVTGYVSVSVDGENVSKAQCTGQITIQISTKGAVVGTQNVPLKFVNPKRADANNYCVAVIPKTPAVAGNPLSITANEAGSPYFAAATATAIFPAPAQ